MADPLIEHVRIEVTVIDAAGEKVIFSGRAVEFNNGQIHLNKTTIRDDWQGLRYGRHLLRNAYKLALDLKLEKLALTASMHGPWVWPRAGFLPNVNDWSTRVTQAKIVQQLYRLPNVEMNQMRREALRKRIESSDPSIVRTLSLLTDEVWSSTPVLKRVKLGWYLLVEGGAGWEGSLRLDDKPAVERLKRYLKAGGIPL